MVVLVLYPLSHRTQRQDNTKSGFGKWFYFSCKRGTQILCKLLQFLDYRHAGGASQPGGSAFYQLLALTGRLDSA